jgi:hypothetical protein
MPTPEPGDIYLPTQIQNPKEAWKSRITVIKVSDKGIQFQREHPYHSKDGKKAEFSLDLASLEKSLWRKFEEPADFQI